MISKIITLIGAVITAYALVLCTVSNITTGIFLVALLGIATLLLGVFYHKIRGFSDKRAFKIGKIIVIVLACAEVFLLAFLAFYGCCDNADYNEDAVIVLGAGIRGDRVTSSLKMRLDKAIEYHHKNPDAVIVVTGGKGFQETVTEAFAMEKYLVENGVDPKNILKEEKATSTEENMTFSKEILDSYFTHDYSIVVITNDFHVFRATRMAKTAGFDNVSHMHAGSQWYNIPPNYLRETLAVMKTLVFG